MISSKMGPSKFGPEQESRMSEPLKVFWQPG